MNQLQLFLPCAAGVEELLAAEVKRITGSTGKAWRAGVQVTGSWRDALQLNLHSRLAQRVLIELQHNSYRSEQDLYNAAAGVAWEIWFTPKQTFKVEITAQHSPLTSLNFAALKIKDAIADRFRDKYDVRPDVDTRWPDVRVYAHLTTDTVTLYIDTSGEPLFKRGWREDKGDAPLKETLAAAMLAASGWSGEAGLCKQGVPLYDPCCGSGTIVIEAAQIACNIAAGMGRHFAFEKFVPFQPHVWEGLLDQAEQAITPPTAPVFGSDVSFRMVDFAERNAERAGVSHAVQLRGGDALQRMPPAPSGVMLVNPPYGERIDVAGVAGIPALQGRDQRRQQGGQAQQDHRNQPIDEFGQPLSRDAGDSRDTRDTREEPAFETSRDRSANPGREQAVNAWGEEASDFFPQLASHWKKNYAGWTAHVLTPDMKLPQKMRLKESRRVPMWNGPIECRLFRFDMVAGSAREKKPAATP
ncbi:MULTISPECIES: THUMP domain-containing protein [unclassified Polaromonas]|jgi:putative N6-adenine-specific DNA methylase|uniref:THUMP domain-containing class I SAM-dependent RNA methyltransferase n=1 Tax=unclassified Polaromonas TaxID=2638319 RepID=UPI000BD25943|nr:MULTISPECIES: THUMP domain-containing protein [unclassified Polaromonas]OYY33990.1 MAG: RNA methyltransferase [Polaromonas sp. 35-63-35]OYZ20811.1 MAG: RNA methyltransferase [Polaromonas sp. 16-63-31]OYZ78403.1 MAG: RNA methyltransferase [Polaromonas sp. 24-63-21]OZA49162.1 MAG: RNA methyltransferase [Polaromonas sp. 17-63-33]OZA85916.1 MAG: RNA methyltransferase [Polaromonas sp. 39-63-25]